MLHTEWRHDGGHFRIVIDAGKGNVLTIAMVREIRRALTEAARSTRTRLVTLEGAGDHFSYGASVEEHLPASIAGALDELHGLVRELLALPAPTAAIVRGRCLGGGFEVALACDLIFAASTALLGVPEITLGVFPPAASALLPLRAGATRAASAILTGRVEAADRWAAAGLVELIAPPQELAAAVDRWYDEHLAPRPASALRCAALASRSAVARHLDAVLPGIERLYLDALMAGPDAAEGITAFLEKRKPVWRDA